MIYFYVIAQEIDNIRSIISQEIGNTQNPKIEIIRKQPFWSFLLKEYIISDSIVFQFKWSALILICLGILYSMRLNMFNFNVNGFWLNSEDIYKKIIRALRMLLLPCMAFYLIQMPFTLKHFWLYFFLVFLVFFLAHYFLPRITSCFYPHQDMDVLEQTFTFGGFRYCDNTEVVIFLILSGVLLFFKFPYNHWVYFFFGIFIFYIIICWLLLFYALDISGYKYMYHFGTLDFYKLSFNRNEHPDWVWTDPDWVWTDPSN